MLKPILLQTIFIQEIKQILRLAWSQALRLEHDNRYAIKITLTIESITYFILKRCGEISQIKMFNPINIEKQVILHEL